jgi:transcriptional regulator with XRE-family HTH domain
MELRDYLHFKRITTTEFAKIVGTRKQYISRISNGYRKPGEALARKISEATNGEVSFEELMSIQPKEVPFLKRQKEFIEKLKAQVVELTTHKNVKS